MDKKKVSLGAKGAQKAVPQKRAPKTAKNAKSGGHGRVETRGKNNKTPYLSTHKVQRSDELLEFLLKKLNCESDNIVKIKRICITQTLLIKFVKLCNSKLAVVACRFLFEFSGSNKLVLCGRNHTENRLDRESLVRKVKRVIAGFQQTLTIVAVIDCKA